MSSMKDASNRKEITQTLTESLIKHVNPNRDPRIYTAKEVTFDYGTDNQIRVDYMQFRPMNNTPGGIEQGSFYCYEIKSCKDDFMSGHGLNFIGDYNYVVMPFELYEELKNSFLIPYGVGVYTLKNGSLLAVKYAKNLCRKKSAVEMLLMMFRSSNRDLLKLGDKYR